MIRYWLMKAADWLRRTPLAWILFWEHTAGMPPPQPLDDSPRRRHE
jgi:hypothetical protein